MPTALSPLSKTIRWPCHRQGQKSKLLWKGSPVPQLGAQVRRTTQGQSHGGRRGCRPHGLVARLAVRIPLGAEFGGRLGGGAKQALRPRAVLLTTAGPATAWSRGTPLHIQVWHPGEDGQAPSLSPGATTPARSLASYHSGLSPRAGAPPPVCTRRGGLYFRLPHRPGRQRAQAHPLPGKAITPPPRRPPPRPPPPPPSGPGELEKPGPPRRR